jgi:hypothetical protein
MTSQVAMTRMSVSGCNLLAVSMRGSGKFANKVVSDKDTGHPPDALGVTANPYAVSRSKCARPAVLWY